MIVGNELRAWAGDRERQLQARRASAAFAHDWASGPVHQAFTRAMANLDRPDAAAVAAAVRPLLADAGWVATLIGTLAAEMRRDAFFEPPFRHLNSDVHGGLVVYEDDHVSIAAGVTTAAQLAAKKNRPRGGTSIAFSGQLSLFRFVTAGGATLSFWECPPIGVDFSAAAAGRCRRIGERAIADGELLTIDGRRASFVVEHARYNLVILQAVVKPGQAPVSVEYDSATGKFVGCAAADDSASRIQMIATLIRKLGAPGGFEAIAAFLGHDSFFVRWHVMRELLGIDADAALPHLERMAAHDPHPETRRVARATLDGIARRGAASRKAA